MQRLKAGAEAQETTGRILVRPRPLHWPDLPHGGLEESCWGPAQVLRVPQLTQNFSPPCCWGRREGGEEGLDSTEQRFRASKLFFSGAIYFKLFILYWGIAH